MMLKLILCTILLKSITANYNGYKVYSVTAKTELQNQFLKNLEQDSKFDFWSKINKFAKPVEVMVSPAAQSQFENNLIKYEIEHKIEIDNVQKTIDAEAAYHSTRTLETGRVAFDQYLQYGEITAYLTQLANDYPKSVRVSSIGHSHHNHTMNIIRISNGSFSNPVLFIEAGNHAREWISPAMAIYIINQLVENTDNKQLLENLDWVILPSLNPDGYIYSWNENRLWRKTRSPGIICQGTDGNRNYGFHWMEKGASSYECSETYAGRSEFSEIEARNLRDVLDATQDVVAFVSLHSYGQLLFYPYSYDEGVVPDNWRELRDLAQKSANAIAAVNGTNYTIGSSTEILYPAAGCSDDWAMGGAGIDIVLTFELPGGGPNGFDLPPARILPVCRETWEGIKVIASYVAQNKSKRK